MYTDNEQRTGLPIKTFLLSLILIIIFILLLMWLLPMPNSKNNNNGNGNGNNGTTEITGLDALTNRIFNANIQEMKNAAVTYFTKDTLPSKNGQTVTLTLQEMLDKKLLLPFTDKNGNSCDTDRSYVSITKKGTDSYVMKVNLSCDDQEDYILVNLGCYAYCTSAVCEKKEPTPTPTPTPTPKPTTGNPYCTLYVSNGRIGSNSWYVGNVVVSFKTKGTTASGASITAYGLTTLSSASYNKNNSYTVSGEGTTTVYGYVKDSNGKTAKCSIVVKKDTVAPKCNLTVLSGTKSSTGDYVSDVVVGFSSKTDATSGIVAYGLTNSSKASYNNASKYTITTNGTHTIYGYVKDAAGHTAKCNITVKRNYTDPGSKPSCTLKITNGTVGSNGWYKGNVTIGFASKTTTNGATIKSYGIGTKETYGGNDSYTLSSEGTTVVYGYVKDSKGNTAKCSITVKKDATKPSCTLKVTSGTYNQGGYYTSDITIGFASKTDATSGITAYGIGTSTTYSGNTSYKVTAVGTHTIYGYVKDAAGNTATCSIKVEKRQNLEYQYKKDISAQYSAWSDWTTSTYNPSNPPSFGKYTLIEIVDLGKTQEVDYYKEELGEPFYKYKTVKVGTATQKYCTGYNYFRDTKTTTTTTYAIKEGADWKFEKMVTTTGWPTDTLSVKYEFVGFDWKCTGCETTPRKIWNKYTRTVGVVSSTNTVTTSGISVTCAKTETRTIEIFDTVKIFVDYEHKKVPVYKDVYKYKQRTRTLIKKAYTDYKWSYYNDQSLLNAGYTMTGNTRVAG